MAITDTTTLIVAIQELVRDLTGELLTGTATAGSSTQITDTSSDSPIRANNLPDDYYVDRWYYVRSGTNNGDERRIYDSSGTSGTIDAERAHGSSIDTSSVYDIYPFSRSELKQAINDALDRLMHEDWLLISELADGDMRNSGTSDWSGTDGSVTLSKVTTTADRHFGPQSLRVENNDASDYAQNATAHNVVSNRGYRLEAVARIASGTANLIAYDATNSAAIDNIKSSELSYDPGRALFRLVLNFTTPATCKQIRVRLSGDEASADIAWNYVSLMRTGDREFLLPDEIEDPRWVAKMVWRLGSLGTGDRDRENWFSVERGGGAGSPLRVRTERLVQDGALWAVCERPYAQLSSDSDTTYAPRNWLIAAGMVELLTFREHLNPNWNRQLGRAQARFSRLSQRYQPNLPRSYRMEEPF